MICPNCKVLCSDDDLFCKNCETPLNKLGQSEDKQPGSGGIILRDTGMIKNSTIHSETHIDSHNIIGASAVGGNLNISFGEEKARATKIGEHCPVCGSLVKDDYFKCKSCGKNFICRDHLDKKYLICIECAGKQTGAKGNEVDKPSLPDKIEVGMEGKNFSIISDSKPIPSGMPLKLDQPAIPKNNGPSESKKQFISPTFAIILILMALGIGFLGYKIFSPSKEPPTPALLTSKRGPETLPSSPVPSEQARDTTRSPGEPPVSFPTKTPEREPPSKKEKEGPTGKPADTPVRDKKLSEFKELINQNITTQPGKPNVAMVFEAPKTQSGYSPENALQNHLGAEKIKVVRLFQDRAFKAKGFFNEIFNGNTDILRKSNALARVNCLILGKLNYSFKKGGMIDNDLVSCNINFSYKIIDKNSEVITSDSINLVGPGFAEDTALERGIEILSEKYSERILKSIL